VTRLVAGKIAVESYGINLLNGSICPTSDAVFVFDGDHNEYRWWRR
jgi:hypothetical protein